MKKTILTSVIGVIIVLAMYAAAASYPEATDAAQNQAVFWVDEKTYQFNGEKLAIDVAPFIREERVFVPVRYMGAALGVPEDKIGWDQETRTVTFDSEKGLIHLKVGDRVMLVNGVAQTMEVAPVAADNRVFLPARWLAETLGYEIGWDSASRAVLIGPPGNLPPAPSRDESIAVVGSYDNLVRLLNAMDSGQGVFRFFDVGVVPMLPETDAAEAPTMAMDQDSGSSNVSGGARGAANTPMPREAAEESDADYSQTNVQVAGVDEADIVKTDGQYIYLVKGAQVIVAEAYPAGDMKIVSRMDYTGQGFNPYEMYVENNRMIIIGYNGGGYGVMTRDVIENQVSDTYSSYTYPANYQRNMVKAVVCDTTDKTAIKPIRELELEGNYVSSRKIGSAFYLLTNKYLQFSPGYPVTNPQPLYRDSAAVSGEYTELDYSKINSIPGFVQPNYLLVAGIDLNKPEEKADVNAYLGAGENIYASAENLYVAVTDYQYDAIRLGYSPQVNTSQTKVYKFALNGGNVTYTASGAAPGVLLNQFSMDEYKGTFRIATTSGDVWRTGEGASKNNVYTLDGGMNVVGKLEGIAPGEKIYSVRFMGDRGYMVTFKKVDPFFVIDLGNPSAPKVLGALKIPGYSDYLHPYDDNHIIGFGKDAIEVGYTTYYTGMKMAVFDVTDVTNPVEMFTERIGGRGTESPLLNNHKALLFSKEKNLLALPITLMEVNGPEIVNGYPASGDFTFQGAYVYNLDLTDGFQLKGRITHLTDQDYLMAGSYWYDSEKNVERILYINDVLYTVSGISLKANNISDLAEIGALSLN